MDYLKLIIVSGITALLVTKFSEAKTMLKHYKVRMEIEEEYGSFWLSVAKKIAKKNPALVGEAIKEVEKEKENQK